MTDAIVVGAGPAGLMAAEVLAAAGHSVVILEAKATPARKFLMAGKSGLNLTKDEEFAAALARYDQPDWLKPILQGFDNRAVMGWARGLGAELFTGSTGRVFPVEMKASRLLRAWLSRLDGLGVRLLTRHKMRDIGSGWLVADTPDGERRFEAGAIVLALGGASWPRLGSDGVWTALLAIKGVVLVPFVASNAGLSVAWSPHMAKHFGAPVKNARLMAGSISSRAEFVVSSKGLEGGGIYEINPAVRVGAEVRLDLLPDLSADQIAARLARGNPKDSTMNRLRKTLELDAGKQALLREFGTPAEVKALVIRHQGPRPLGEAISTAGGISRQAVDDDLMLKALPGVYVAGEMLDWDAPTGGYLLTACLAMGRWAGRAGAKRIAG